MITCVPFNSWSKIYKMKERYRYNDYFFASLRSLDETLIYWIHFAREMTLITLFFIFPASCILFSRRMNSKARNRRKYCNSALVQSQAWTSSHQILVSVFYIDSCSNGRKTEPCNYVVSSCNCAYSNHCHGQRSRQKRRKITEFGRELETFFARRDGVCLLQQNQRSWKQYYKEEFSKQIWIFSSSPV